MVGMDKYLLTQYNVPPKPENNKVLGIVCARKGSKRLPDKNSLKINGVPLAERAYRTLDKYADKTVLVTDIELFKNSDMNILDRPEFISRDHVPLQITVRWACNKIHENYGIIIILFANSPLIKETDVVKCLRILRDKKLNIVRTYHDNVESGLIILRSNYFDKHWIDTNCGAVMAGGKEIHTLQDYNEVKLEMEK